MLENRPDQRIGRTWRRKALEYFLNVDVYAKTREGPVMTSEILTVPHNVEAEQSVIGGLLLDDDNSERVQKCWQCSSLSRFTSGFIRSSLLNYVTCSELTSQSMG